MRNLAKKAMTTRAQKACYVLDHLIEALANDPSSPLRRAMILAKIAEKPGITQAELLNKFQIGKSAMNREIDWLFNYGCVMRQNNSNDGRSLPLEICGYSKQALDSALEYCDESYENLQNFIRQLIKVLKLEKPALRDARIIALLHERGGAKKQEILSGIHNSPASTTNRALKKMIEEGVVDSA